MSTVRFRDLKLEQVLTIEGIVPSASRVALEHLESYMGRPIGELAAVYWQNREAADRRAQERVASATDETTILDYYRNTTQYLYELTYSEGAVKRQGWLRVLERVCRRQGVKRMLDLGGGIGSVSLYFHRRGIPCDYLDVPGPTFDYAAWRFSQCGLRVATHDATQPWPAGPYDAIIAWDVLEHLKHLEEKVSWIAQRLRKGGLLIHLSTFTECEGVHLPENMAYGDIERFNAMLRSRGFRYRGQLKPDRVSRIFRRLGWRTATLGFRVNPRLKFGGCFLIHEHHGGDR